MEPRKYLANAAGSPPSKPTQTSDGYPQTAVNGVTEATAPGPYWYYQLAEELRNLLALAGVTPDHSSVKQLHENVVRGDFAGTKRLTTDADGQLYLEDHA